MLCENGAHSTGAPTFNASRMNSLDLAQTLILSSSIAYTDTKLNLTKLNWKSATTAKQIE